MFPRRLCEIDLKHQTPANAIIAQTVWAVLLMVAATTFLLIDPPSTGLPSPIVAAWKTFHERPLYDILYTYVIFGGTIFYGLAILSVFVLRAKRPDLPRPYRTWGYPFTPLLYTAASPAVAGQHALPEPLRVARRPGDRRRRAPRLPGLLEDARLEIDLRRAHRSIDVI